MFTSTYRISFQYLSCSPIHTGYPICTSHIHQYTLDILSVPLIFTNTYWISYLYLSYSPIHTRPPFCTSHIHQYILDILSVPLISTNTYRISFLYPSASCWISWISKSRDFSTSLRFEDVVSLIWSFTSFSKSFLSWISLNKEYV